MIKTYKDIFVKQRSINDCGVACLKMIFNYYDINKTYDEIKNNLKIDNEGVSAYEIIKICRRYNLDATCYKNFEINDNTFPLIVHTINNNIQHFVVILKKYKNNLLILDPSKGKLNIKINDFNKVYTGIAITFNYNDFSFKNLLKNKASLIKITIITFILSFINIIYSYYLSNVITSNKLKLVYILFMIGLYKEFISYIKESFLIKYKISLDKKLTIPLVKKVFMLPQNFYQNTSSGELISKINDLSYVKNMLFEMSEVLFINVFLVVFSAISSLVINTYLGLLNIVIIIVIILINKYFYKRYFYKTYDLQIKNEVVQSDLTSYLGGITTIKNLNKENYFINKVVNKYNTLLDDFKYLSKAFVKKDVLIRILSLILIVLSLGFLIYLKQDVTKIIFISYIEVILIDGISKISMLEPMYENYKSALYRIEKLYDIKSINNKGNYIKINSIKFVNLRYKYDNKLVINKFNLNVKKGDFALISGPTGSGKSTLFKVLTKNLEINKDYVFINNISINKMTYQDINKNITYVDQKIKLFNDTIYNNIYLDSKNNIRKNVKKVIEKELFKNNLSYNYVIDNTSSNLSGGQMQMIVILRTLIQSGDVIIFDETTNQLDENIERKVLLAIKKDYKDKIVILISHRKSNLDLFNKKVSLNSDK